MNRWGIPDWLEEEIRVRDKACVYQDTVAAVVKEALKKA